MNKHPPQNPLAGMVDIETMDVEPSAAIVTIGACLFDPYGTDTEDSIPEDHKFQATISLEDNEKQGRTLSASTVKWWLQQSEEAQNGLFEGHQTNLKKALTDFNLFINNADTRVNRIWAKDPDFDCVILQHAFKSQNMIWPFKFWETRSVRTITEEAYPDGDQPLIGVGVAHKALDDAIRQALMVQHCRNVILGRVQTFNQ